MTGMIGCAARCVGRAAEDLFKLLPAIGDRIEVGHIGHGAACGEIRQDDGLVGAREHVGGLGHEVHAAEDDGLGLGASPGGVRELEGVADEVRVLDHLVALIEVAQDNETFALAPPSQRGCGRRVRSSKPGDTPGEDIALLGRASRQRVVHRSARPVTGLLGIKHPWRVRQSRGADAG